MNTIILAVLTDVSIRTSSAVEESLSKELSAGSPWAN